MRMTQDWRAQPTTSWLRVTAVLVAAALFLCAVTAFLFTLIEPFEDPRLFLLTCDGDPATAAAAPLQRLSAVNPLGTSCHQITSPPGTSWLQAIDQLGEEMLARDTAVVYMRGAWIDQPELALSSAPHSSFLNSSKLLRLEQIIHQLNELPAENIVLCLDDSDPDLDQFSERLNQLQTKAVASRVIIVTSHRLGEESFPLPTRQCTAFGDVVSRSFCATADRNQDSVISVGEFLAAIQRDVAGWAAELTGGRESQTPLVISPTEVAAETALCRVLHPVDIASSENNGEDVASNAAPESIASPRVELSQVTQTWELAAALTDRAITSDVPLVICHCIHRDLVELERRWRFGESTAALHDEYDAMLTTLTSLTNGQSSLQNVPQWAIVLASMLEAAAEGSPANPPRGSNTSGPSAPTSTNTQTSNNSRVSGASQLQLVSTSSPPAGHQRKLEALSELSTLLSEGASREATTSWLDQHDPISQDRSMQLVRKLTGSSNIPDDLWRGVLLTRLNLELNRSDASISSWTYADWTIAERAALRSERLLIDQIEQNWLSRSRRSNMSANTAIMRGHHANALSASATRMCRNTVLILPDLLELDRRLQFWENDPAEVGTILDGILESVARLRTALGRESLEDAGQINNLARSLETDRLRLLQPVNELTARASAPSQAPPSASDLMRLLRSQLLSSRDRAKLLTVWQQLGDELPSVAPHPTSAGQVIVRGLADGLDRNFHRRMYFAQLFGPTPTTNVSPGSSTDNDANMLDALMGYEIAASRWRIERPGVIRQQLDRLLAAPLSADSLGASHNLWDSLDDLQDESQLPLAWPQLAERIQQCHAIQHLDLQILLTHLARNDASAWENECYERIEANLRAARPILRDWPPPVDASPTLLSGPDTVRLSRRSPSELRYRVHNMSDQDESLMLTLQYPVGDYLVELQTNQPILPSETPPWPYTSAEAQTGFPIHLKARASREVTLHVQPRYDDAKPASLLVRLRGPHSTTRATSALRPPRKLPVDLIVEDENGPVIEDERGFSVEPFPNRMSTLRWFLRNNSDAVQHIRLSLHVIDEVPPRLPTAALSTESLTEFLRTLSQETHTIDLPTIELRPHETPQAIVFPKQDDSKAPVPMLGGVIIALSDEATGLTTLRQLGVRPQRPTRFVTPQIEYERTDGRITIQLKANDPERLPREGVPVSARLAGGHLNPLPARSSGRVFDHAPQATLTLLAPPGEDHRVYVDVAGWPRAFLFDVIKGRPTFSDGSAIRITTPTSGAVFQIIENVPVSVEVDVPSAGFTTDKDWFEVGVDANHDRRLVREPALRINRDRHVTVEWLGTNPNGSTPIQVGVADFNLKLPTSGLRNQQADILGRVVMGGRPDVWGEAVSVVFDTTGPNLTNVELQPGPAVVIGEPIVVLAEADDHGLSGVSHLEVVFDPSRTGTFDAKNKPVIAVPLDNGQWRAEVPTKSLEQGRHLLLARGVDNAGNAAMPHSLWLEVITTEEAARRKALRTTVFTGQLLYGPRPASGIKVELTADPTEPADASQPMTTEKTPQPKKPYTATSGKDGKFEIQAVAGGPYTLHISGVLRGEKIDRQRKVTIDIDDPPPALTERLDRPPESETSDKPE